MKLLASTPPPRLLLLLQWNLDLTIEVAGDRPTLFVKSRVRYIENLDVTNLRGNEQTVRYIEVIVNDDNSHDTNAVAVKRIQDPRKDVADRGSCAIN